ncbi:asparaginase [Robiginitalea sp. M366]|uniref:asparaginase n=1 Tax=Robiginitalea aestuariiviva TaxID=3036903 RepID=UPI00240E4676|nr:asparaginase [Robiginitalea aestuariiviva]MDG1571063.1 asparaginase [Robiginitalea aestuariiviva]
MESTPKILLIYTGGTIGMVRDYPSGTLRAFDFKNLLQQIPELRQLECDIHSVAFANPLDSSNMDLQHWRQLARLIAEHYGRFDGFVVLHGSDTMSYTASALSFMLEDLAKPVILTGSQLPIGDLRTDAKENLITTIQLAALQDKDGPVIREVCLYFEYKLYRGNRTLKVNTEHFEAFASPNYPELAVSGVHLNVHRDRLWKSQRKGGLKVHTELENRIGVLKLFPGMHPDWVCPVLENQQLRGLVLETFGAGNAPTAAWLLEALEAAVKRGMHIVNVTQCAGGSVLMGRYETSSGLRDIPLIDGRDITTEAALAKLMYLLGAGVAPRSFKTIFETSLRGELTEN